MTPGPEFLRIADRPDVLDRRSRDVEGDHGRDTVRQTGLLRNTGATEERIAAVASWPDAPYFTDVERAALALVEAVLTPNPGGERVPDELFA